MMCIVICYHLFFEKDSRLVFCQNLSSKEKDNDKGFLDCVEKKNLSNKMMTE